MVGTVLVVKNDKIAVKTVFIITHNGILYIVGGTNDELLVVL